MSAIRSPSSTGDLVEGPDLGPVRPSTSVVLEPGMPLEGSLLVVTRLTSSILPPNSSTELKGRSFSRVLSRSESFSPLRIFKAAEFLAPIRSSCSALVRFLNPYFAPSERASSMAFLLRVLATLPPTAPNTSPPPARTTPSPALNLSASASRRGSSPTI